MRSFARSLILASIAVVSIGASLKADTIGGGDPLTFNFDENGNGQININGGGFVTNNGSLLPDPSQSGHPLVLTFSIPAPGSPLGNGDLLIYEDFIGGTLGDVVRFTDANGALTGFTADRLIFYSLAGVQLADTGLPVNAGAGASASIVEKSDGTFQYIASGPNTYNGISDGTLASAAPAPATFGAGLLLLGALGTWRMMRRHDRLAA
jgi:hypothetical protein